MKRIMMAAVLALGIGHAATLPYQGLATDAKNNPKTDSSYAVVFALYSASSGGTALWSESQKVTTSKGLFSTTLGSIATIPDSLFQGSALYLGVSFGGGSEGGRVLLGTTPWATAAGKSLTSAYADSAGKVAGLADSVAALRLVIKDSTGYLRSRLADTSVALRAKVKADSQAQVKSLGDSVSFVRANVHDTADTLRARLTDSTKALRDTVTSLRSTIAGLNTTLSSQSATLSSQATSLSFFQSILSPSSNGIAWNTVVPYGYVVDSRDGQVYRTVRIGTQTWMAQNLNYRNATGSSDTVGVCYSNSADNCAKYGRLYTWAQVMNGSTSSSSSPSGVKGICPTGWHVPSDAEWTKLTDTSLASATAGTLLKTTSDWITKTGTDTYGFRALPGGYVDGTSFVNFSQGNWWSATEYDASFAQYRYMDLGLAFVNFGNFYKTYGFSLRCVKD